LKLTILRCETKRKGLYLLSLKHGDQEFFDEVKVTDGVVPYIEYSEKLQQILHKEVGEAKNMNKTMFKIYCEETVNFPIGIGEF
jgi:hypothetical protein